VAYVAVQDLEFTAKDVEGLIATVVDVDRRLIARIGIRVSLAYHEGWHGATPGRLSTCSERRALMAAWRAAALPGSGSASRPHGGLLQRGDWTPCPRAFVGRRLASMNAGAGPWATVAV
jgi:hypothetical protein